MRKRVFISLLIVGDDGVRARGLMGVGPNDGGHDFVAGSASDIAAADSSPWRPHDGAAAHVESGQDPLHARHQAAAPQQIQSRSDTGAVHRGQRCGGDPCVGGGYGVSDIVLLPKPLPVYIYPRHALVPLP